MGGNVRNPSGGKKKEVTQVILHFSWVKLQQTQVSNHPMNKLHQAMAITIKAKASLEVHLSNLTALSKLYLSLTADKTTTAFFDHLS